MNIEEAKRYAEAIRTINRYEISTPMKDSDRLLQIEGGKPKITCETTIRYRATSRNMRLIRDELSNVRIRLRICEAHARMSPPVATIRGYARFAH